MTPVPWIQVYDPLAGPWLSTAAAALPIVLLLFTLGVLEWRAHFAAAAGLVAALAVATLVYGMPVGSAGATAVYGAAYGFLPIGWIILNAVFLYNLTVETGQFEIVKASVSRLSSDRRIQALLVAFAFGAFIEGASGFGTPVAICAALLIGLGFTPLYAAGLSLIANTAPVAFGAIGTPILTLAAITGIPAFTLGAMAGRQLPFVSLIVPAWLVVTMSGWRGLRGVWPAVLVCGGTFAAIQFAWSNFVGPELVDIIGGLGTIAALGLFLTVWHPRDVWEFADADPTSRARPALAGAAHRAAVVRAWMPWLFLSVAVIVWGLPATKTILNGAGRPTAKHALAPAVDVPLLHRAVFREYPVVTTAVDRSRIADPAYGNAHAEAAQFTLNWASATGTAIFLAALATALFLRVPVGQFFAIALTTLRRMRAPLATIMLMMALGFVTRYGGTDATLGLAFTRTGWLYPFFAALLGWLGVALTGSDTSSNVLFGSLQKITAQQLGLNPVLIVTANSTGGVMGKMIDAQSIVVATASTGQVGHEGRILRFVFWHSIALAALMGAIVMLQAYVFPWMVP
ncbi:MAG: lactate permease [Acidobacteria bacterium RIFCSPLOWO2_02_FULL_67_36]|nr:MAG: lactate permease [Acidobacteria bacterium RIFCSPLOWO2_02_FULL_67_36]OFW21632.1 MAG: lactate permease [Acidobacteria bacterium RIFCSPLOWO2_12_FULL_66_21]